MQIIKLNPENPETRIAKKAASAILSGGVVAIPTDTAYGLAVNARDPQALAKLDLVKDRPKNKPYPIAVLDLEMARKYAEFNSRAIELARKFWPGALTLILKRKKRAKILDGKLKTVGVRVPASSFCRALSKILGLPYTITSANFSGKPTAYSAAEIVRQFQNQKYQPDLILDAGRLPAKEISTVADLSGGKVKILREGAIKNKIMFNILKQQDPSAYRALLGEQRRQKNGLELIASENYASAAVLAAMGSVLTNKYSEGYPGKRYYGGNKFIDQAENLAIARAKKLFRPEHVNVQPYSGSPANLEVYFALVPFGGKIMGLSLAHGGHLTHGHKVNFSGKAYQIISYGVEKNGRINYAKVRAQAIREKPNLIISGYTAYPRRIDFKKFRAIADEVGAIAMADISHIAGLIAAGLHENPAPYFDVVTTTTHKTLRGPRGAMIMCKKKWAEAIDRAVFPGMQGGPHNHITLAKAVAFGEALKPEFKTYCRQIMKNAKALANALIALKFDLVSGGTDNHLMLVDLTNKKITGKEAEHILEEAGITLNKNMVPFDPRSPFDPSGVRIGAPAVTSRGMREIEMMKIAKWIDRAIRARTRPAEIKKIKNEIEKFCADFPVPGIYTSHSKFGLEYDFK